MKQSIQVLLHYHYSSAQETQLTKVDLSSSEPNLSPEVFRDTPVETVKSHCYTSGGGGFVMNLNSET